MYKGEPSTIFARRGMPLADQRPGYTKKEAQAMNSLDDPNDFVYDTLKDLDACPRDSAEETQLIRNLITFSCSQILCFVSNTEEKCVGKASKHNKAVYRLENKFCIVKMLRRKVPRFYELTCADTGLSVAAFLTLSRREHLVTWLLQNIPESFLIKCEVESEWYQHQSAVDIVINEELEGMLFLLQKLQPSLLTNNDVYELDGFYIDGLVDSIPHEVVKHLWRSLCDFNTLIQLDESFVIYSEANEAKLKQMLGDIVCPICEHVLRHMDLACELQAPFKKPTFTIGSPDSFLCALNRYVPAIFYVTDCEDDMPIAMWLVVQQYLPALKWISVFKPDAMFVRAGPHSTHAGLSAMQVAAMHVRSRCDTVHQVSGSNQVLQNMCRIFIANENAQELIEAEAAECVAQDTDQTNSKKKSKKKKSKKKKQSKFLNPQQQRSVNVRHTFRRWNNLTIAQTIQNSVTLNVIAYVTKLHLGVAFRLWRLYRQHRIELALAVQQINAPIAVLSQEDNEIDKECLLCVVCLDAAKTHLIVPCGHQCVCSKCASCLMSSTCPICRCQVQEVVQVFL